MDIKSRHNVNRKIKIKLWIYFLVFIISLMMSMFHFVKGNISFYFPLGGFISGFLIGHVVSRMNKVMWDEDSEMIDLKLDKLGIVILLVYLTFVIFKNTLIEDIVHLHHISSISLAVLSGTMLGHAVALRKMVLKITENYNKSLKNNTMEEQSKKEALKEKLQEEMAKWQTQFDELTVQIKLGSMEASDKLKEQQKKLKKEFAQAKVDLKHLDKATGEAWQNINDGLKTSFETMKEAFDKAKEHYK